MKALKKPVIKASSKIRILKDVSNNEKHQLSTYKSIKQMNSKDKHSKDSRMSKV